MRKKRLVLATTLALALVAASGALVWAGVGDSSLPCGDITGGTDSYTKPVQNVDAVGRPTWVTPGRLSFTMNLAAPTCLDVTYGLVVLSADPAETDGVPRILATASAPGGGGSNQIAFDVEVNEDPAESPVCVYVYTSGGGGASSTGKTGAAFDGTTPAGLLDRAPDGPTFVSGDTTGSPGYCFDIPKAGGRSYN